MSIVSLVRVSVGEVDVRPGSVKMVSTDNLATITAAGYIPNGVGSAAKTIGLSNLDLMEVVSEFVATTGTGVISFMQPHIVNGVITVNPVSPDVVGIITAGNFAVFANASGALQDLNYHPSNPSKTVVSMVNAAPVSGHLAIFTDTLGTIGDGGAPTSGGTAAAKDASDNSKPTVSSVSGVTVVNHVLVAADVAGTLKDSNGVTAIAPDGLQAGFDGHAGQLKSFAPTAGMGNLSLAAADNSGNFNVVITNDSLNQSSNYILPGTNVVNNRIMVDATGGVPTGHILSQGASAGEVADGGVLGQAAAKAVSDNSKPSVASVLTVTTVGHVATFGDTAGSIQDGGALPSFGTAAAKAASNNADAALASVPNAGVSTTHIAKFTDGNGSIGDAAGVAINDGDIHAGASGIPGKFVSFPNTVGNGSFGLQAIDSAGGFNGTLSNISIAQDTQWFFPDPGVSSTSMLMADHLGTQQVNGAFNMTQLGIIGVAGVNNGLLILENNGAAAGSIHMFSTPSAGAFTTQVTNDSMAQSSTVSIPDPGVISAHFAVAPAALVVGNLVKASATTGLVADAGFALKKGLNAAVAGGSAANTIVDASVSATSVVVGQYTSQTTPTNITTIVPGAGSFVVNTLVDPGNSTFSYIVMN